MTGPEGELTIDQLAAAVGMTVRNVRAYATRGLLPPPRLVGRTGWYGPAHRARLDLIRDLLAEGYTLGAVQRLLDGAPVPGGAGSLALHRSLLAPWLPEEPQVVARSSLRSRSGEVAGDALLDELADMGVVERLDGDRVRLLDPTLVAAGLQVIDLGIPAEAVVAAQREVLDLVEQAAAVYVRMFRDTAYAEWAARPPGERDLTELIALVGRVQPVAAQALLAAFRSAMGSAVAAEFDGVLAALHPAEADSQQPSR